MSGTRRGSAITRAGRRSEATLTLDTLEAAALAEVASAQEDGFVSEDERKGIDGRLQRVAVLLGVLLQNFEKEVGRSPATKVMSRTRRTDVRTPQRHPPTTARTPSPSRR